MVTLMIRDRNVRGNESPIHTSRIDIMRGESLSFLLDVTAILPVAFTVLAVTSDVIHGRGITLSGLSDDNGVVTGLCVASADAAVKHLLGLQLALSGGDTWEFAIPVVTI